MHMVFDDIYTKFGNNLQPHLHNFHNLARDFLL